MRLSNNIKVVGIISLLMISAFSQIADIEADPTKSNPPGLFSTMVTPNTGDINTTFSFSTIYLDYDNDSAQYVKLVLGGIAFNMTSPFANSNVTRGIPYYYNTTLASGSYNFYIEAMNVRNETVRDPSNGFYNLNVDNGQGNGPRLVFPIHSPDKPDAGEVITFNVTYEDPNGAAPVYVRMMLQEGGILPTKTLDMNATGTNYTQGVVYTLNATLSRGYHYFWFEAMTADNVSISIPVFYYVIGVGTGTVDNPIVLSNASRTPLNPKDTDLINFAITYTDADNDPPTGIYVEIFDTNESIKLNLSSPYSNSYSQGVRFNGSISLPNGTYIYYFMAVNYFDIASDPAGFYQFTVGNSTTLPYLSSGSHTPIQPDANSTIDFQVTYNDPDGNRQPHFIRLRIKLGSTFSIINMSKSSGDPFNGSIYKTNLSLPAGNYQYYFEAIVGNFSTRLPRTSTYNLSVSGSTSSNNDPTLTRITHSNPPKGGGNVTFKALYTDIDGDAPTYIKLHIGPVSRNGSVVGQYFTTYNMSWNGATYTTGILASRVVSLSPGSYKYYLTAASGNSSITVPESSFYYVNVSSSPQPPLNSPPALYSSALSPLNPTNNQTVKFSIYYKDLDGDAPSYVSVHIGSGNSGSFSNNTMTGSGTSYKSGVQYTFSTKLSTGTYYYYFKTTSKNDTVHYPSSTRTLSIAVSSGQQSNDTNRTSGSLKLGMDGDLQLEISQKEDGIDIVIKERDEKGIVFSIISNNVDDRIISLDLGYYIFDRNEIDDISILLDQLDIKEVTLEEILSGELDTAGYYIEDTGSGLKLHLFIPDATNHELSARLKDDQEGPKEPLMIIILALIALIAISALISLYLLSAARKRRMKEAYYEDFEIGLEQDGIRYGNIDDDDPDWDDLLE